ARRLVEPRQRRVREDVVWRELAELLRGFDRAGMLAQVVQRQRHALPGVGKLGIERNRLLVRLHGLVELAVRDQVDGAVEQIPLVGDAGMRTHSAAGRQARIPSHDPMTRATLTPRTPVPRVARVSFEAEVAAAFDAAVATGAPLDFERWTLRIFRHQ